MISQLENLSRDGGELTREAPDEKEFTHHVNNGLNELNDAKNSGLHLVSRFNLAYSAAFSLSFAALRKLGYRPREKQRYIVFQCLQHTLKLEPEVWQVLNGCHKVRNDNSYRISLKINEQLVSDLINACQQVADTITQQYPLSNDNQFVETPPEIQDDTEYSPPKPS